MVQSPNSSSATNQQLAGETTFAKELHLATDASIVHQQAGLK